jgi:hypothetical protein
MMMFRALTIGLLGAIALLVASSGGPTRYVHVSSSLPSPASVHTVAGPEATVVDVSKSRAGKDLMPFLGLRPGERIIRAFGMAADSTSLNLDWADTIGGGYIDVGVRSPDGTERRILVIVHP